jgi:hypothetical protein
MKLIAERHVTRSSTELNSAYWAPILRVNHGTERRYRKGSWDFLGLFDKYETEWEDDWVIAQIIQPEPK